MNNNQLPIPGLEMLKRATTNAGHKRQTLEQQFKALQDRVLTLELEVSLLRILMDNPKKGEW